MTPAERAAWNKKYNVTSETIEKYRHRCQTDLKFLAGELGYSDFVDSTHDEVFAFFLKKDPSIPFKEFAASDTGSHDRLLLLPRGGFKSTIDEVDIVQYILCWPDIRILILTGTEPLAKGFLSTVQNHFRLQDGGEPRVINGTFSKFQIAFPEYCSQEDSLKESFDCPLKSSPEKEPTIMVAGVEKAMSGWHFDVIKSDDSVSNENTKTVQRIRSVNDQLSMHRKMLHPYGYWDSIGTLYNKNDFYGRVLQAENANGTLTDVGGRRDSQATDGVEPLVNILVRPAMTPVPGKETMEDSELTEADWVLWFPERLTYRFLVKERTNNPETFATQYMNNPGLSKTVRFHRDKLVELTRVFTEMPESTIDGLLVQCWDTANKGNVWNDYSVGITALFHQSKIYVLDMKRGQWGDDELPEVMAGYARQWNPRRIAIEDTNGVRFLTREVSRLMRGLGLALWFEYIPTGNRASASKAMKAIPLKRVIDRKQLVLSNAIPSIDSLYDELESFPNGDNDDIVDALANTVNHFQESAEVLGQTDFTPEDQRAYDFIHQIGRYENHAPVFDPSAIEIEHIAGYIAYDPSQEWQ